MMVGRPYAMVDRMVGDLARILTQGPLAEIPEGEDPVEFRKRVAAELLSDPEFRRDYEEYLRAFNGPNAFTGTSWADRIEAMLSQPDEILPETVEDGILNVLRSMILDQVDSGLFWALFDALRSRLPDLDPAETLCHLYEITDPDQPFRTWAEQALEAELGHIPNREILAELWTDYCLLDRGYMWFDDFDSYWENRFAELRNGKEGEMS